MATTNVYLIMSEPMFDAVPNTGRHAAGAVFDAIGAAVTLDSGKVKEMGDVKEGSYGTGVGRLTGAIEVHSFNFGINQVGTEEGGRPRSVEDIRRTEFSFTKAVDSRSPKLFKYCCEGTFIGAAELQVYGPTGKPYLTYRMTYVHVSSYEPSGGTDVPTEKIGLRYGQMAVKWDDGAIGEKAHGNTKTGVVINRFSWVMQAPFEFPSGIPGLMEGSAFGMH